MEKTGYGHFNKEVKGGYVITQPQRLIAPWEYIYENGDILLKVDQNGPVAIQANPVTGILLIKREWNENFSKWNIEVEAETPQGVIKTAVFGADRGGERTVSYSPDCAVYRTKFDSFVLTATLYVADRGVHAGLVLKIENTGSVPVRFQLHTKCMPYCNEVMMAPWDKPEWYLQTRAGKTDGGLLFVSRKTSPYGKKEQRKIVTFNATASNESEVEISLERYCGAGNFVLPARCYSMRACDLQNIKGADAGDGVYGYPSVYAYSQTVTVAAGETHVCAEVISAQSEDNYSQEENRCAEALLNEENVAQEIQKRKQFFQTLFSKNSVCTKDSVFDGYVNSFLPLQLHWIGKLDRGWMTGMHGVRDLSNDYLGLLPFDAAEVKNKLLLQFSCQQKNGWFPRQISGKGKHGQHDFRRHNDSGAVVLELVTEYVKATDDTAFLKQETEWLDDDNKSTVLEHILTAVDYYLQPENIGEHGLCKIYEGDWLDAVNRAGLEGRGESVMISAQMILMLRSVSKLLTYVCDESEKREQYLAAAEQFKKALLTHALNQSGFFNGMYTDGGYWLFSECDPDGNKRVYIPANSYAIISGAAEGEVADKVIENVSTLRGASGYKLFSPAFGAKEIPYAGRIATGDMGMGLWENATVYNHAQGFYARALATAGEKEKLQDILSCMLPFYEDKHPCQNATTPPYAMVNCWQEVPCFRGRGGLQFLTGSVAITVRAIYHWLFGITPEYGGVSFQPCLTSYYHGASVRFCLGARVLHIKYLCTGKTRISVNGQALKEGERFVPFALLKEENEISVEY